MKESLFFRGYAYNMRLYDDKTDQWQLEDLERHIICIGSRKTILEKYDELNNAAIQEKMNVVPADVVKIDFEKFNVLFGTVQGSVDFFAEMCNALFDVARLKEESNAIASKKYEDMAMWIYRSLDSQGFMEDSKKRVEEMMV